MDPRLPHNPGNHFTPIVMPGSPRPDEHAPTDLRTLYYLVREQSWIIAVCLVLTGLATATYLLRSPKIFAARSVLQVEQEESKVLNIQRIQQEDLQTVEFLKTVEQTLQNPALIERVIDTNSLLENRRLVSLAEPTPTKQQVIERLAKMIDVRLRKGTRLIDITVEHTDPLLATLVANSLVQEFMRLNHERNSSASEDATALLTKEARELEQKLEASEQALQNYKERMQGASLEDRQNTVIERLKEMNTRVTEAKSQTIMQETVYAQVQFLGTNSEALLLLPAVANNPAIADIKTNIARKESEIASLRQRYKWKHPKMIQAESELAEWKSTLERAILNFPQTVRNTLETAKAAEQAMTKALQDQETAALEVSKQAIQYNVLSRDVESDRTLYQSVLSRIKETSVTKDLAPDKVRVIQYAQVPERPVKPNTARTILAGILGGLGLSVMVLLIINGLDNTFKTVDQLEEVVGLPVLSAVPKFKSNEEETRRLVVANEAQSSEAEAFRTLRTAISMLGRKDERRTFLFTSAVPAEGKTFTSLNFALSLAQQGLRTVIIDCDLRRPTVEKSLLKTNVRGVGVTDYLIGQKTLDQVIHATETENFFYLPAGTDAPNPAELLAQIGIDKLVEQALEKFDRVVIDSAPIHAVSDTLLIASRVHTACLVVRTRKTPRKAVRRAVQLLKDAGAPLSGVVLNMMPRGGFSGYYYDTYYNYQYHGYYGDKKDRKLAAAA
jgi:polysaccharide biosynthesis transport protein